jgi:hypothetical protein
MGVAKWNGLAVFVEKVKVEKVGEYVTPKVKSFYVPPGVGGPAVPGAGPRDDEAFPQGLQHMRDEMEKVKSRKGGVEEPEVASDMRCLAVEYDGVGNRSRPFISAVKECQEDNFADWPLEGPRTMMWLLQLFVRLSMSPVLWLERHLQSGGWSDTDRAVHEMRVYAEVFELALGYVQLNMCVLGSFERLARRWQAIMEAHSRDPLHPDYDVADKFSGMTDRGLCVAPALRAHVAKEVREEAEIDKQRSKAREVRGGGEGTQRGLRQKPKNF